MARVAFAAPYPPRRSGVAVYTEHLVRATSDREVVSLPMGTPPVPHPVEVHHRVHRWEDEEFTRAAALLSSCVDLVSIQYHPRAWGEPGSVAALTFARQLAMPMLLTPHEVESEPTPEIRAVMTELLERSVAVVALSEAAAGRLVAMYGINTKMIVRIPHGVPDVPRIEPEPNKPALGLAGRPVILTFGLLRPGKGCEAMIEAMPAVLRRFPTAIYAIVGATDLDVPGAAADTYRASLTARVAELKLGDSVRFVDSFVGRAELIRWLQAADVIVTPNADLDQSAAGSLAYALAVGRAVVSTPDAAAGETLADGLGVVVEPGSAEALATAVADLLDDDAGRRALGERGHAFSRALTWTRIAATHEELFAQVARDYGPATGVPRRGVPVIAGGRLRR